MLLKAVNLVEIFRLYLAESYPFKPNGSKYFPSFSHSNLALDWLSEFCLSAKYQDSERTMDSEIWLEMILYFGI